MILFFCGCVRTRALGLQSNHSTTWAIALRISYSSHDLFSSWVNLILFKNTPTFSSFVPDFWCLWMHLKFTSHSISNLRPSILCYFAFFSMPQYLISIYSFWNTSIVEPLHFSIFYATVAFMWMYAVILIRYFIHFNVLLTSMFNIY
jgi:hypothetical protein